jgi:Ca2+-transporting ATPase
VPGLRSRQNSVDSDDDGKYSNTTYSGETFANTASSQGDKDRVLSNSHGNEDIMNDRQALTPDPGVEEDFKVDDNKFAFSQGQLNKLINPKSLAAFYALGGLAGLEKGLRTDRKAGLSADEVHLNGMISFEEARASARKSSPSSSETSKTPIIRSDTRGTTASMRKKRSNQGFADRKRIFDDNHLPEKKGKNILQLMWITYNDKVLILLSIAAAISLGVGLYQTFGTVHDA